MRNPEITKNVQTPRNPRLNGSTQLYGTKFFVSARCMVTTAAMENARMPSREGIRPPCVLTGTMGCLGIHVSRLCVGPEHERVSQVIELQQQRRGQPEQQDGDREFLAFKIGVRSAEMIDGRLRVTLEECRFSFLKV